ncbi:hypothetical protein [Leucobacter luti]|uniref:Uncharacterized protein n=1 Tax=Leucobacter luti TaxID=340320 RepID=A0A4Q7U041_9MICO|nr:hypothetical protein [Leucobacter luti]MBL3698505.1 hypothetical protein [Leucobacter luti]RZT65878.1 hypothetical protein EV139_1299 [Leucobacter luti]
MAIGKYLTSPAVLGAALGAVGTARRAGGMPRDWRRFIVWGVWLGGLALAVASVAMQDQDQEFEVEKKSR